MTEAKKLDKPTRFGSTEGLGLAPERDLVERLRDFAGYPSGAEHLLEEAADALERSGQVEVAARSVIRAFEALGRTRDFASQACAHKQCEAAMLALDNALKA
jgi:hypothetical protein